MSWTNPNPIQKHSYNEGNKIATSADPVWSVEHTGIPISDTHVPCGYWFNEPAADLAQPTKKEYGLLYGAGRNDNYQLGRGTASEEEVTFDSADSLLTFTKVVMGRQGTYMLALASNSTLWCVGVNQGGCFGLGDATQRTILTQIPGLWSDIATSHWYYHSLGIKTDGTLWSTGLNNFGQLGLGDKVSVETWTQVGSASDWVSVDCGSFFSMAVNSSGELWACGDSYQGATGLGYDSGQAVVFTNVGLSDVIKVSCGYYYTIAETSSGLFVTGANSDGQYGLGNTTHYNVFTSMGISSPIDFCAGWNNYEASSGVTFVIKSDGTLWAAGSNRYTIMGTGDTTDKLTFIDTGMTGCVKVHSKENSVLLTKSDGTLHGCGKNLYGELGLGHDDPVTEFEQVGSSLWNSAYCSRSSMAINWDGKYDWE